MSRLKLNLIEHIFLKSQKNLDVIFTTAKNKVSTAKNPKAAFQFLLLGDSPMKSWIQQVYHLRTHQEILNACYRR